MIVNQLQENTASSSSTILSTFVCGSLSYTETKAQLEVGYSTPSPEEPCFLIQTHPVVLENCSIQGRNNTLDKFATSRTSRV